MFSANENLLLRQHKKRVVEYVESCIPEEALDMGTMVMAMQVSCKAPGCVPLETAIVIVFPKLGEELVPGLPESCGGNYKTKVLKPMAEVTKEDILEALPPEFPGGQRSLEKLCIQARDVMLGQITQLFADEDQSGRKLMAEYLQHCLQEYVDRDCTPPEWGEPFPPLGEKENAEEEGTTDTKAVTKDSPTEEEVLSTTVIETTPTTVAKGVTKSGNFVFKRPKDEPSKSSSTISPSGTANTTSTPTVVSHGTSSHAKMPKAENKKNYSSQSIMERLGERQHAPGIRRPGCPCCDPDNANNLIDETMAL